MDSSLGALNGSVGGENLIVANQEIVGQRVNGSIRQK
jgi:hypothetical protein